MPFTSSNLPINKYNYDLKNAVFSLFRFPSCEIYIKIQDFFENLYRKRQKAFLLQAHSSQAILNTSQHATFQDICMIHFDHYHFDHLTNLLTIINALHPDNSTSMVFDSSSENERNVIKENSLQSHLLITPLDWNTQPFEEGQPFEVYQVMKCLENHSGSSASLVFYPFFSFSL